LPDPGCGAPEIISDELAYAMFADHWQGDATNGGLYLQTDPVQMGVAMGTAAPARGGLKTAAAFSLVGGQTWVQVNPDVGDPTGLLQPYLRFERDPEHYVEIRRVDGALIARIQDGATPTSAPIVWNASTQPFWKIQDLSGVLSFRTSTDGITWSEFFSATTPSFATVGDVRIGAELASGSAPNNLSVAFGQFNVYQSSPPFVAENWCSASSFSTDFTEDDSSRHWRQGTAGSCTITATNGSVQMAVGTEGECHYQTRTAFLVDDASVEIVFGSGAPTTDKMMVGMRLVEPWGNTPQDLHLTHSKSEFIFGQNGVYLSTGAPSFVCSLRMAESAGMITFSYSTNCSTYVVLDSTPLPGGFLAGRIELFLSKQDDGFSSGSQAFSSVN
jgi:hypothetical protein